MTKAQFLKAEYDEHYDVFFKNYGEYLGSMGADVKKCECGEPYWDKCICQFCGKESSYGQTG